MTDLAGSASSGFRSTLDTAQSIGSDYFSGGSPRNQIEDFYRSFKSELGNLFTSLTDDKSDIVLDDGTVIPAAQKDGAAAAFAIPNWMQDKEFVFNQLLDAFKFMQNLENKLNNAAS